MRRFFFTLLTLIVLLSIHVANGQDYVHPENGDPGFLAESEHFIFFSHMWLNMHHYLYNTALVYRESGIDAAIEPATWERLDPIERRTVEDALKFYAGNMTDQDLRTGGYNYSFKRWVVQHAVESSLPDSEDFAEHVQILNGFQQIYADYDWAIHDSANKLVLRDNIDLIRKNESSFVESLTRLCKADWQDEKIRIDISFHSKRDIPYTTTRPTTHIVMDSKNSNSIKGNWFELLLHEASHQLITSRTGFVGGTVSDVVTVMDIRAPKQLYHAYLFYFSGRVAQDLLKKEGIVNYQIYMARKDMLFTPLVPLLDKHLSGYMVNKISLAEATREIVESFHRSRK